MLSQRLGEIDKPPFIILQKIALATCKSTLFSRYKEINVRENNIFILFLDYALHLLFFFISLNCNIIELWLTNEN